MESLKPCPFCGGSGDKVVSSITVCDNAVLCRSCGVQILRLNGRNSKPTADNAIVAWNTRPNDAILEAAQKVADEFRKPGLDIGASIDKDTSFWLSIDTIAALLPKRETQEESR